MPGITYPTDFPDLTAHGLRMALAVDADGVHSLVLVGMPDEAGASGAKRLWFSPTERPDVARKHLLLDRAGDLREGSLPPFADVVRSFPDALVVPFSEAAHVIRTGLSGLAGIPAHVGAGGSAPLTWAASGVRRSGSVVSGMGRIGGQPAWVSVDRTVKGYAVAYGNSLQAVVAVVSADLSRAMAAYAAGVRSASRGVVAGHWAAAARDAGAIGDGALVVSFDMHDCEVAVSLCGDRYVAEAVSPLGRTALLESGDLEALLISVSAILAAG